MQTIKICLNRLMTSQRVDKVRLRVLAITKISQEVLIKINTEWQWKDQESQHKKSQRLLFQDRNRLRLLKWLNRCLSKGLNQSQKWSNQFLSIDLNWWNKDNHTLFIPNNNKINLKTSITSSSTTRTNQKKLWSSKSQKRRFQTRTNKYSKTPNSKTQEVPETCSLHQTKINLKWKTWSKIKTLSLWINLGWTRKTRNMGKKGGSPRRKKPKPLLIIKTKWAIWMFLLFKGWMGKTFRTQNGCQQRLRRSSSLKRTRKKRTLLLCSSGHRRMGMGILINLTNWTI